MAGWSEGGKARCFRTQSSPHLPGCLFKVQAHVSKDNLLPWGVCCPESCYKSIIICVCCLARHSFFTPNFCLWNHSTLFHVCTLALQQCHLWGRRVTRWGHCLHATAVWANVSCTSVRISLGGRETNSTNLPRGLSTAVEFWGVCGYLSGYLLWLEAYLTSCALR